MTSLYGRLYGVSFGNGNDGVSHMFPAFYCYTLDPWMLARAAMLSDFKPAYLAQAAEAMEVDGEADYTISAMILDPLDSEPSEDEGSYSEANGAWMIVEVFGEDEPRDGRPIYDCLSDCFSEEVLRLAREG